MALSVAHASPFCQRPVVDLTGPVFVEPVQTLANPKGPQAVEDPAADAEVAQEERAAEREADADENRPSDDVFHLFLPFAG